jgi:TctA family transporter
MSGFFGAILDFFLSPKIALILFTLFLVGYITYIAEEGGFSKSFLHFGPGTDAANTTTFIGIRLDSWTKVGTLYAISFLSALMTSYYQTVMGDNLHSYIWNRALKSVPYSRTWTYIVVLVEPFFYQILSIIQFFTNLTLQLQFILPQFLGSMIAEVPFVLRRLGEKRFDQI